MFKVAAGVVFYNDKESLRRTLTSLCKPDIDIIFAIDGKFPNHPGNDELSTDGSREMIKRNFQDKAVLIDAPLPEYRKRQTYLDLCGQYNCDILLIIDSDEYIVDELSYWEYFRRELYDKIVVEGKEEHNIFNIKMHSKISLAGGHLLDLLVNYPRIWFKPYEMHYARARHFEFMDKNGNIQTGSEANATINSLRLKHDSELRTKIHEDDKALYQTWLRDYEANLATKEWLENDWPAIRDREKAAWAC